MTIHADVRLPVAALFGAALAAALLSGCATSDDTMSSFLVAPGKYVLYNCDDIARTAESDDGAPERAGTADGESRHRRRRPVDQQRRLRAGIRHDARQLNDLRAAAAEKKCNSCRAPTRRAARATRPR